LSLAENGEVVQEIEMAEIKQEKPSFELAGGLIPLSPMPRFSARKTSASAADCSWEDTPSKIDQSLMRKLIE